MRQVTSIAAYLGIRQRKVAERERTTAASGGFRPYPGQADPRVDGLDARLADPFLGIFLFWAAEKLFGYDIAEAVTVLESPD